MSQPRLPQPDNNMPPMIYLFTLAALPLALLLLRRVLFPSYDPREPPVLRPKIPFLGHAISIAREASGYYTRLYKEKRMPICTLPVLNGKLYVVNSPALISAAMRSRDLSFDPFVEMFSKNALGLSDAEAARLLEPGFLASAMQPIHPAMTGEPLREMAAKGLERIAVDLNGIGSGAWTEIPNVADWLRDVVSQAMMVAMYGEKNPITPDVLRDILEYDKKAAVLALGLAPRLLAPKALAARDRVQTVLREFYEARLDQHPDVSAYVRNRAAAKRSSGVKDSDMGVWEFDIPWAAVTNTIPSLIWLFANIFSRTDYVERARAEALEATEITGKIAVLDTAKLEKKPFLSACFHEIQRRYNNFGANRRVIEDTVLKDVDGREYLLKKGTNVQWFSGVPHMNEVIWGGDADAFHPERFIDTPSEEEKKRRGATVPFGGGRHLCPGRMFAVTELFATVGALALAFDIEGVTMPAAGTPYAATAMRRPLWGPGEKPSVRIRRRRGWEEVQLTFAL
ncbi:hypothetical protein VTK56DRAFT_6914 [Thermocarpiscus australiensis]